MLVHVEVTAVKNADEGSLIPDCIECVNRLLKLKNTTVCLNLRQFRFLKSGAF